MRRVRRVRNEILKSGAQVLPAPETLHADASNALPSVGAKPHTQEFVGIDVLGIRRHPQGLSLLWEPLGLAGRLGERRSRRLSRLRQDCLAQLL